MRVEHPQVLLNVASREESPNRTHWQKVVALIYMAFQEGHIVEECIWKTAMLIPKGHGDLHGIGLVKFLFKTVTGVISFLCAYQGTRTPFLESKMLHKLMEIREEILYNIFIYLHKAYDTLVQERLMDIMTG